MLFRFLRILVKGPLAVAIIIIFFAVGILNKLLFFYSPYIRKTIAQRNTQFSCWACRHTLGYRGRYLNFGTFSLDAQKILQIPKGHLLICNHMSYMDVLVIASKIPTLFVTSTEMRDTPFLGWITRLGECLYVNRRSHKNLNDEIKNIQNWINQGFNVLIFPEATTGNGAQLKPFKSSLLQLSQNGVLPLTVFCLKYKKLNSKPMTVVNLSETIAWFDNAGFISHFFKQLQNRSVYFELKQVDSFLSSEFTERKTLVARLESKISDEYNK